MDLRSPSCPRLAEPAHARAAGGEARASAERAKDREPRATTAVRAAAAIDYDLRSDETTR